MLPMGAGYPGSAGAGGAPLAPPTAYTSDSSGTSSSAVAIGPSALPRSWSDMSGSLLAITATPRIAYVPPTVEKTVVDDGSGGDNNEMLTEGIRKRYQYEDPAAISCGPVSEDGSPVKKVHTHHIDRQTAAVLMASTIHSTSESTATGTTGQPSSSGPNAGIAAAMEPRIGRNATHASDEAVEYAKVAERLSIATQFDICFLVDTTASMKPWIAVVKNSIIGLHDHIQRTFKGSKDIRWGLVGYSDFDQDAAERISILDFTSWPDKFTDAISKIQVRGGGDMAEDVMGGLCAVLDGEKMHWREDVTKLLVHITDSPAHGSHFHDSTVTDSYPLGDPAGSEHHDGIMRRLVEKRIHYYFGKITDKTDRMVEVLNRSVIEESGREMHITSFNASRSNSADFQRELEELVKQSALGSLSVTLAGGGLKERKEVYFVERQQDPNFKNVPELEITMRHYKMPSSINAVLAGGSLHMAQSETKLKIAPTPFAMGAFRLAYLAQDVRCPKRLVVVKRSKYTNPRCTHPKRFFYDMETQAVTARFSHDFNNSLKAHVARSGNLLSIPCRLEVVALSVIKTRGKSRQQMEGEYMTVEPFLHGQYRKFTSNATFQDDQTEMGKMLVAFSHWSYHQSKGFLLIGDLQGTIGVPPTDKALPLVVYLTDPCIHCLGNKKFRGSTGNYGAIGFRLFFAHHTCNRFCDVLDLPKQHKDYYK